MIKYTLSILSCFLFITIAVADKSKEPPQRTAPYFVVDKKEGVEAFPLLKTEADIKVSGAVADVELTQVYKNSGEQTIEAVYVFPMSTSAAIHGMTMEIGNRTIKAEVQERKKARETYEEAKDTGKATSLLEQDRPNVFTMNVANIMPGDVVNVTVEYTELLVPDEGDYEFIFPTVVGPRFTGESDEKNLRGRDDWTANPYQPEGEKPGYAFNIKATLRTGIPISKLEVPSHRVNVEKSGAEAKVTLAPEERKAGNKDFVLRYSLRGDAIQSGLLLHPGEEANHFLLMMEPPAATVPTDIPPREYLFIVDVSGSMYGFPLDTSKYLIERIIRSLRPSDYFNILFFAGGSTTLADEPLTATTGNIEKALKMLNNRRGGGSTRILDALKRASKLPKKEGMARSIVVATDGKISVEKESFDLIREGMSEANFFTFGIGKSVNRYLIEGMAGVGQGKPFVVLDAKEAERKADAFVEYVSTPLLTDIDVSFEGFDAYDVQPQHLPDLFSERPLILHGKYREANGSIQITGKTAEGTYFREFEVTPNLEDETNTALPYLWARKKLETHADYAGVNVDNRDKIVQLGLKYGLMTAHTSFVAVDTKVRDTGETVTVKQRLPLPEGVSNRAIGSVQMAQAKTSSRKSLFQTATESLFHVTPRTAQAPAPLHNRQRPDKILRESDQKSGTGTKVSFRIASLTSSAGIGPKAFNNAVISQIGTELDKKLQAQSISDLDVELTFKKGNVTDVKVDSYKGAKMDEQALAEILKKLTLGSKVSGRVKLVFEIR